MVISFLMFMTGLATIAALFLKSRAWEKDSDVFSWAFQTFEQRMRLRWIIMTALALIVLGALRLTVVAP